MLLRVQSISYLADRINAYELVDPAGADLPAFTAGSHIDLRLKNGLVRQYSLCNDPADRRRYKVAILKEIAGRGGSRYLHEEVRVGELIEVAPPRNNFPLSDGERHVLIAGGIGITPMIAMISELERRGQAFQLYYCTRSPAMTAFAQELRPLVAQGRAVIHHDGGDPTRGLDLTQAVGCFQPGVHLYYCGPSGFMSAVKDAARDWPSANVHCEYFSAPPDRQDRVGEDRPFRVRLSGRDEEFEVPSGASIVSVLRRNGIEVETSCEDGYCGTCMTRYVGGEPEHRDDVLDEESRKSYVLICCARAKTPVLELDL